ncbi:uncharacterized protein LOC123296584 [Chrysoperla carnea]|uniref:uncharacterized protein LOC123296584 n=1 Tax=Chrysoperla carnea TaxID=189513 RepID=UPI001D064261|nr:uncharacterized protein LOC123296584 [Chrysoperla carnea]
MCNEDLKQLLTNEVCENLIAKKLKTNEFKIINTIIKPLSDAPQGFSGTHFFLKFEITTKNELKTVKFFLKFKLDLDASIFYRDGNNDIYGREAEFLQLTTQYNVDWAPKLYDYVGERLLVLEDLSERGFTINVERGKFNLNDCFAGIQSLAKLNAFYFQLIHDKKKLNPNFSILKEYSNFFKEVILQLETNLGKEWCKATIDSFNCILDEMPTSNLKIKKKINEKFNDLIEYLKPVENQYKVISHGDLWSNNIMFSNENGSPRCCFIDYQLLRFLPPAHDILTLLHLNTTTEFRRQHDLNQFFDYYYEQFSTELNKIGLDSNVVFPMDVFKASINTSMVPVLLLNCMVKSFLLMDFTRLSTYIAENDEGLWTKERAKIIKHELDTDEKYKQAIFEEFQVLIDEIVKLL